MTALVIFVIGCVICLVSGLLGGFRQLEDWDGARRGTGEDKTAAADTDIERQLSELTADTLRRLEVELGGCRLDVRESEDGTVWLCAEGDTQAVRYSIEDGKALTVSMEDSYFSLFRFGRWVGNRDGADTTISLYLPKGAVLDSIELELGAGEIDADVLQAEEIAIDIGAGKASIASMAAREADLDVGAGKLTIEKVCVTDSMDLDIGAGKAEINGVITGDLDVDCGMGNLTMALAGTETDHLYEVDCAMGSVTIGGRSYAAFSDSEDWGGQTGSVFDIDCSMGSVAITFDGSANP